MSKLTKCLSEAGPIFVIGTFAGFTVGKISRLIQAAGGSVTTDYTDDNVVRAIIGPAVWGLESTMGASPILKQIRTANQENEKNSKETDSDPYEYRVWLLSLEWLHDTLEQGEIQPEEEYDYELKAQAIRENRSKEAAADRKANGGKSRYGVGNSRYKALKEKAAAEEEAKIELEAQMLAEQEESMKKMQEESMKKSEGILEAMLGKPKAEMEAMNSSPVLPPLAPTNVQPEERPFIPGLKFPASWAMDNLPDKPQPGESQIANMNRALNPQYAHLRPAPKPRRKTRLDRWLESHPGIVYIPPTEATTPSIAAPGSVSPANLVSFTPSTKQSAMAAPPVAKEKIFTSQVSNTASNLSASPGPLSARPAGFNPGKFNTGPQRTFSLPDSDSEPEVPLQSLPKSSNNSKFINSANDSSSSSSESTPLAQRKTSKAPRRDSFKNVIEISDSEPDVPLVRLHSAVERLTDLRSQREHPVGKSSAPSTSTSSAQTVVINKTVPLQTAATSPQSSPPRPSSMGLMGFAPKRAHEITAVRVSQVVQKVMNVPGTGSGSSSATAGHVDKKAKID